MSDYEHEDIYELTSGSADHPVACVTRCEQELEKLKAEGRGGRMIFYEGQAYLVPDDAKPEDKAFNPPITVELNKGEFFDVHAPNYSARELFEFLQSGQAEDIT